MDREQWSEVWHSLRHHRLRTVLTAFGVFWGVFMMMLLVGTGNGLENGLMDMFRYGQVSEVYLMGNKTAMPFQGLSPGRPIRLTVHDIDALSRIEDLEHLTPEHHLPPRYTVRYGTKTSSFDIVAMYPGLQRINKMEYVAGRRIHPLDIKESRKVVTVSRRVVEVLLPPGQDPIGTQLLIEGIEIGGQDLSTKRHDPIGTPLLNTGVPFLVVGVYAPAGSIAGFDIMIPHSTYRQVFDPNPMVNGIRLTVSARTTWERMKDRTLRYLAARHRFDPADSSAIRDYDNAVEYRKVVALMIGVRWFLSVIGVVTLVAGCIGVSNIMLVTVRERTREIGIRKTLGATPYSIMAMIVQEALMLTVSAGCLGLAAGMGVLAWVRQAELHTDYFRDPHVDLSIAIGAVGLIAVAGLVAGLLPAVHAVQIRPIEALRHE